mmetsp:Transcript_13529/g.35777  ORF Transcript_13529/g.35777 Transcript_13529/m.35777 type:complete len:376 (+) Transcript_13529:104-1231(+)
MTVSKSPESRVALSLHEMLGTDGSLALDRQVSQISTAASNGDEDGTGAPKKNFQPYHAQSVPKPENLEANASALAAGGTPVTTMMLRNIPNKYTQNTLLQEIDDLGFASTYDFFYLPMDVHNRSNVGYAFINFLLPPNAERFRRIFSDHRFQRFQSRKISSVCTAHVQGLDSNLRHFENRAVTHSRNDQYRPVVLRGNVRVDFEEAVAAAKGWGSPPQTPARPSPVAAHTSKLSPATSPSREGGDTAGARLGLEAAIRDLFTVSGAADAKAAPPSPPGLCPAPMQQSLCSGNGGFISPPKNDGSDITQLLSLRTMLVGRLRETDIPSYFPKAPATAPSAWASPAYVPLPSMGFGARLDTADQDPRMRSAYPAAIY